MKPKPITLTAGLVDAFWRHVEKQDQCWRWIGDFNTTGYARLQHGDRMYTGSRVSFAIHNYDPPADVDVCHTCDNRWCVNPAHLALGSPQENSQDMTRKGRNFVPTGGKVPLPVELRMVELFRAGRSDEQVAEETGFKLTQAQIVRRRHHAVLGDCVATRMEKARNGVLVPAEA